MISGQFCRYFNTGNTVWQSTAKSLLGKLRKKTGYTFANCKKALDLHENDITKAEAWLKEQAQSMGWAKAQKLQGRSTSQGLIAVMVENNYGALVEINCETDFVARNKTFQGLAEIVVATTLKYAGSLKNVDRINKTFLDAELLKNLSTIDGKTIADHAALTIGTLGENISVKRGLCMTVDPSIQLVGCTHPAPVNPLPASFGRYGALLAFQCQSENQQLGLQLCQHIIGMNPTKIGNAEGDKPISNTDEETIMIHQDFLLDPSLSVQQVLLGAHAEILDFARYEMGESNESTESTEDNISQTISA
ncbi:hypothetical protein HCN44_002121 [Aphidius gifuensis]|uniref:Elongation factor Ts, mitochondrial n=1 Tax=Aphidius gifuensis TaxID=684658 RepID=A0A834Y3K5_APHGI|nr:elongation factor Ts, mitochondrial [Aphidius gifuensis]KAF7996489.1 hypothetical protein HCN44_002121 [Aphidius gifuensis]